MAGPSHQLIDMLNVVLIETGKVLGDSDLYGPENQARARDRIGDAIPKANARFQTVLSTIEMQIMDAKAVMERDLSRIRKRRAARARQIEAGEISAKPEQTAAKEEEKGPDSRSSMLKAEYGNMKSEAMEISKPQGTEQVAEDLSQPGRASDVPHPALEDKKPAQDGREPQGQDIRDTLEFNSNDDPPETQGEMPPNPSINSAPNFDSSQADLLPDADASKPELDPKKMTDELNNTNSTISDTLNPNDAPPQAPPQSIPGGAMNIDMPSHDLDIDAMFDGLQALPGPEGPSESGEGVSFDFEAFDMSLAMLNTDPQPPSTLTDGASEMMNVGNLDNPVSTDELKDEKLSNNQESGTILDNILNDAADTVSQGVQAGMTGQQAVPDEDLDQLLPGLEALVNESQHHSAQITEDSATSMFKDDLNMSTSRHPLTLVNGDQLDEQMPEKASEDLISELLLSNLSESNFQMNSETEQGSGNDDNDEHPM